jgi:opacity protein-like surface antigen
MHIMSRTFTALVASVLAGVLAPAVASAQVEQPEPAAVRRPWRGLFGGPPDPRNQSLDLTFSLYGAYDDDVYADQNGIPSNTSPDVRQSGWFGGASAGLDYNNPGERASLSAGGGVGMNLYSEQDDTAPMYRGNVALGLTLPGRSQLSVEETFVAAPEFRLGLFASPEVGSTLADPFVNVVPDYDVVKRHQYRTTTGVGYTKTLGAKSSLTGLYSFSQVIYPDDPFDYRSQTGAFTFGHRLTRHASLHIGYGYSAADYIERPDENPHRLHTLDMGVDYGRALSISRRTRVTFSTGSAFLRSADTLNSAGGFTFHVLGAANLIHEMGRTWTTTFAYNRSVQFHEGFTEPLLSNAVTAELNGLISRRLRFDSLASYSFGRVGAESDNSYNSAHVDAGLEFALTRMLALYTRYLHYRYSFDEPAVLDPRVPPALDRQGVRFGLNVSVPLVR